MHFNLWCFQFMMGLLWCNPIISQGIYMYSYCVEISEASVNKIVGSLKTKSYSHIQHIQIQICLPTTKLQLLLPTSNDTSSKLDGIIYQICYHLLPSLQATAVLFAEHLFFSNSPTHVRPCHKSFSDQILLILVLKHLWGYILFYLHFP